MKKSLIIIIFLTLLIPFFLSASDEQASYHVIDSYNIEVKGSSNVGKIKSFISPSGGEPVFKSVADLEKELEDKKRILNNKRIFEEISYTYEPIRYEDDTFFYQVNFYIKDAFTFLAIPYPKYDSNYGFRLGVKAYDTNLLGSFSDLYFFINATQIDSSWSDYDWDTELAVTNIPFGPSSLNLNFIASAEQHGKEIDNFEWKGSIDWKNIKLDRSTLRFNLTYEDKTHKNLTASFTWSNLPFFNSNLTVRPTIQIRKSNDESPWYALDGSFYTSISPIKINDSRYTLSNTFYVRFPHEYFRSTTKLNLVGEKVFNIPFGFWIGSDNYFKMKNQEFYDNTYSIGTSLTFKLPFSISYIPSFEFSIRDNYTSESNLEHVPMLSTTQTFSSGAINWRGNLRHGAKWTLGGTFDYLLFDTDKFNKEHFNWYSYLDFTGFLKTGERFQLSGRALAFYSSIPSFDHYPNTNFPAFMPNGTKNVVSLVRGILDRNYYNRVGKEEEHKLGAVFNLDATLLFIKLGKFADGFVNIFSDVAVVTKSGDTTNDITKEDLIVFKTIGFEGYGIVRRYPSYPIRASLGFNFDDIVSHIKGDIGFSDIEFVLTIGMGLHY